jgi:hypothetical protein
MRSAAGLGGLLSEQSRNALTGPPAISRPDVRCKHTATVDTKQASQPYTFLLSSQAAGREDVNNQSNGRGEQKDRRTHPHGETRLLETERRHQHQPQESNRSKSGRTGENNRDEPPSRRAAFCPCHNGNRF